MLNSVKVPPLLRQVCFKQHGKHGIFIIVNKIKENQTLTTAPGKRFQASLVSTLIVSIVVSVSCTLAYWQFNRIEEKKVLQHQYQQQQSALPLSLNALVADGDDIYQNSFLWRQLTVDGDYLNEHSFLLDSQVYQGKPGYHVISPFVLHDSQQIVLVNRGWLPAGINRQLLPLIPPSTESTLRGQFGKIRAAMPGFEYQQTDSKVQLFINIEQLSARIGSPVLPMVLLLDEYAADPLQRQWPEYQANIEMHEFYVVHWLIVALLAAVIYLYFGFKPKAGKKD